MILLTRVQAMHHKLIWRYVYQQVQSGSEYSLVRLKEKAIRKYKMPSYSFNCVLCKRYHSSKHTGNFNCVGCPLFVSSKMCAAWIAAKKTKSLTTIAYIRDIKLDIRDKEVEAK